MYFQGDVVRLVTGDVVPTDGMYLSSTDLLLNTLKGRQGGSRSFLECIIGLGSAASATTGGTSIGIDESMLTGESLAIWKSNFSTIYGIYISYFA